MKYPDGKNGLHQERERRLTDQYHFVQRLRNKDERFSSDPAYVFASAAYLEKKQLQRNVNVSYNRGKKNVSLSGEKTYSLEDGFSVFDKISNTPSYWKTAKYEMFAKLDNLGPFQFFFTVSCADSRWDENFSSILANLGIRIRYEFDSNGSEQTIVIEEVDGKDKEVELRKYLKEHVDKSLHEIIRTNVMNATRNYNHRVKAFIKEIVMDKSNPMEVKHYSTKVEFQGRGAGHNHGTLWIDLAKMETYFEQENGDWIDLNSFLRENVTGDENIENLQNNLIHLLKRKYHSELQQDDISEEELRISTEKLCEMINQSNRERQRLDTDMLLSKFPLFGITSAFKKFQTREQLLPFEEQAIINFANRFTTCTLNAASIERMTCDQNLKKRGSEVVDIVRCVNIHNHTRTCKKYDTICRFGFGKFPIWKTLISKPSLLPESEKQEMLAKYTKILKDVRKILDDEEALKSIISKYPNKETETRKDYVKNREKRIKEVLQLAGLKTEDDFEMYVQALETSKGGYSIILERDIDEEMFVNSYNPEWVRAWNGNTDLQICLDYYAVITYITEYYTKDDSGTMTLLLRALQEADCDSLKEKMVTLMNTYISARQMGETEAFFKIFPDLHLKDSNVKTVFVPLSNKENRSKFLVKVDESLQYGDKEMFKIEGREGYYVEKYDVISKYERSKNKQDLSFSQFSKMYAPAWKKKKKNVDNEASSDSEDELQDDLVEGEDSKFDHVMKCFGKPHTDCKMRKTHKLKDYIEIENPYPGEPPLMKKRRFPAVLRFHKFKFDKDPKEFLFSESLLYIPFKKEEDLQHKIDDLALDELVEHYDKISCVKGQVMEHLENVQEARFFAEENKRNEDTEVTLDPEGIQEIDDCQYEGIINHPDYLHIDFEAMESEVRNKTTEKTTANIDLDDLNVLLNKTRNLDFYQSKVVESAIRYSRSLVKSLKLKNPLPIPPKMMVHGGAGAGKTVVVNVMKQWVQRILETSGDNPECPYILVTAPTGTAAANVRGQTMHSAFGFHFGNEHFSLPDKKRDEKRTLLKNLQFVIIDEISMVKCDQLFQLDMRLREVKQKPDKIFGGVAVFAFGDIMQLKPCQARYIFEEPRCQAYKIGFFSGTHWQSFEVINLEENHRQGSDKDYADILNRIRIGQQTTEDIDILQTRVRPPDHPDMDGAMFLSCKNINVNELNAKRLNAMPDNLVTVEAVNMHSTIRNFKAHVNSKGNIGTERNETPFRQTLDMKVGARIMLTYNIDVGDCLTNGARGDIVAFEINKTGYVEKVIVRFDEKCQGEQRRKMDKSTDQKYPGCTAIERVMFQYSLSKRQLLGSNTAKLVQFPLKLCFATTAHKFQGQTVVNPSKLVVDLRTVFEAAQAYVMLSRVQSLEQIFILGSLPAGKFFASMKALKEMERMENISMNKNPPRWEENGDGDVRICSLNCQSLQAKIDHIKADQIVGKSDLICLSETWLLSDNHAENLQIEGFDLQTNSVGRGRGLATYFRPGVFEHCIDIREKHFQLTKMKSKLLDVITVYRSQEGNIKTLEEDIKSLINMEKNTVICGDLNICYKSERNNQLIKNLEDIGFQQHNQDATHFQGGVIDHVYMRLSNSDATIDCSQYSPYYCAMDHDALLITINQN